MPSLPPSPFPRPPSGRASTPQTSLKILVAGVDRDARSTAEAAVRRAFAGREREPWSISLVLLGAKWSVTLSGPGERFGHLSFIADPQRLEPAIRDAIDGDGPRPGAAAPSTAAAADSGRSLVEDRHVCPKCQKELRVSYESQPGEAKQPSPVACPHCWAVIHVEIGGWAAAGGDYSAEKL